MRSRARVLVVEDEPSLAELLRLQFRAAGWDVVTTPTGEQALDLVDGTEPVDVVVLDLGLAGQIDGVEVCRRLRARDCWVPVLMVTARDDEVDRVMGLETGADDYVTKPYSPRELVARVRALLRREEATRGRAASTMLRAGQLVLDVEGRSVTVAGAEVELTATEFNVLAYLLARPQRICPREELLSAVWGYPPGDSSRTVDVHIAQLRAKLGADCPVRTVRGVGYGIERHR